MQAGDGRLSVHRLPSWQSVFAIDTQGHEQSPMAWSADGTVLAAAASTTLTLMCLAGGASATSATVDARELGGNADDSVWSIAVDDAGQHVAVGRGGVDHGSVTIVDVRTTKVVMELLGFPSWVNALRFTGADGLLTGTTRGRVQLWNLRAHTPRWTTETATDVVQIGRPHALYVVVNHNSRSGTVIRLSDGAIMRRTSPFLSSESGGELPWTRPYLVGDGTLGLEMDPEAPSLVLTETATGRELLRYIAFPGDEWLVYTPDGLWDGSRGASSKVRFYRGLTEVGMGEAERLHDRPAIDRVLNLAFARP
jgi:WD40 repeat protein